MNGVTYKGGMYANDFAVSDSIGVVYQKDNPKNNMTVFEYYDGPSYGSVAIFVIAAIVLALYRWRKINRKYNDSCQELDGFVDYLLEELHALVGCSENTCTRCEGRIPSPR